MGMFMRGLIDRIRKNIIAISSASVAALVATWLESQLRELFKTYVYGWIVDHAKEFVVEREAIMIASLVTYAASIITAVIVFIVVLWMWPRPKSRNIHHVEIREHLGIEASVSPVARFEATPSVFVETPNATEQSGGSQFSYISNLGTITRHWTRETVSTIDDQRLAALMAENSERIFVGRNNTLDIY
jgi:hypothetical protein